MFGVQRINGPEASKFSKLSSVNCVLSARTTTSESTVEHVRASSVRKRKKKKRTRFLQSSINFQNQADGSKLRNDSAKIQLIEGISTSVANNPGNRSRVISYSKQTRGSVGLIARVRRLRAKNNRPGPQESERRARADNRRRCADMSAKNREKRRVFSLYLFYYYYYF